MGIGQSGDKMKSKTMFERFLNDVGIVDEIKKKIDSASTKSNIDKKIVWGSRLRRLAPELFNTMYQEWYTIGEDTWEKLYKGTLEKKK